MPSLRATLFLAILKNRHLLRFSLKKESGEDWLHDIKRVRERAAASSRMLGRLPRDMETAPAEGAPVLSEWIRPSWPEPSTKGKAILYFHGGGYVLGSVASHRGITAKFVKASGIKALLFEYRLAPENPYPAALDDSLAAWSWLLSSGYAPEDLVFIGDSGGGGLCLATLLALRDKGLGLPAGAVALSPMTDLKNTGESLLTNAHRCLAPRDSWTACSRHYAGGSDPGHPYISPLYGDLRGLPPLRLYAGGDETLLSDSVRFASKARQAGVDAVLHVGEGLCHCYPACAPLFPEASQAMEDIRRFVRERLGLQP